MCVAALLDLATAVKLLGLRVDGPDSESVATDCATVNMLCPACSSSHVSRRRTLNLNYEKDAFRCPRCGFAGHTYDLISYYTGWPMQDVESRIRAGKLAGFTPTHNQMQSASTNDPHPRETKESELAPLKRRHLAYSEMLSLLELSTLHRANLKARGLKDNDIDEIGFKSLQRYVDPAVLASKLIAKGHDLRGIPGFGIAKDGRWRVSQPIDGGFLIPLRNGSGLIQGFQIRFDHPNDRTPKYGYFTSTGMPGGTSCSSWCCWAGESLALNGAKPFNVILTEGPLKAYIVNRLTAHNVLAVPGVNALGKAAQALKSMKAMGLANVQIAYDMDCFSNVEVAKSLDRLCSMLDEAKIPHNTLMWDPSFKGLDDWIVGPGRGIISNHRGSE